MKKAASFIVLLYISLLLGGNALSAEIAWMYVQHRQYGEGKSVNRLSFGLIDDQGRYLTDDKNIKAVKLLDLRDKAFKITPYKFRSVEEIYATYDTRDSQWIYNKNWQFDSWFSADILEPLIPGIDYWLKIEMEDGRSAERTFNFNGLITLPVVDSTSFQLRPDAYGNLIWTWNIPMELGQLSLSLQTRARASIDVYKNKINTGYFSIILPSHLGYVFIPHDVVESMNQKGDQFELRIQIETRDKNNRTYSKPYLIAEMLPANPK